MNENNNLNALTILKNLKISYVDKFYFSESNYINYKNNYDDSTRYGLTKCIQDFINMSGGLAVAINPTSRYRYLEGWGDKKTRLELGDIIAIFDGKLIHIEIKKKDNYAKRIRAKIRISVTQNGGKYFNAHDFESFFSWFNKEVNI